MRSAGAPTATGEAHVLPGNMKVRRWDADGGNSENNIVLAR
jgi:hypothetical protein